MGRIILPEPTNAAPPASVATESASAASATAAPPAPLAEVATPAEAVVEPEVVESKADRAKRAAERAVADGRRFREMQSRHAKSEQEKAALQAENTRLGALAKRFEEFEGLARTDSLEAARRLGLTPQQIAKAAIAEGTPEHAMAAMRAEMKAEIEKEYGPKLKAQQEFIDGLTARQRVEAIAVQETAFTTAAADETKYPHLADLPPVVILELGRAVINGVPQEQRGLITNDDLLAFLEKQHAEHRKTRSAKSAPATVSPPNVIAGAAKPRTQVNGSAIPADFDKWNDAKQKRWMAEQLDQLGKTPKAASR